jgi:iron-sulfur cluster repair protein YtfE (RIC family)
MSWRTLTTSVGQFRAASPAPSHDSQQFGFGPRRLWWGQVIGTFSRRAMGSADPACQEPFSDRDTMVGLPVVGSRDSLATLTDQIQEVHHGYLRRELPRLAYLIDSVLGSHSDPPAGLLELRQCFGFLRALLVAHMVQEETRLFPMCRTLGGGHRGQARPARLGDAIRVMHYQNEEILRTMTMVESLAHDLMPPEGSSKSYPALLEGLAELGGDLQLHIFKESTLLFPMTSAAETTRSWTNR